MKYTYLIVLDVISDEGVWEGGKQVDPKPELKIVLNDLFSIHNE